MSAGAAIRIGDAALYHGDALAILPDLEAVDHMIIDPPYESRLHAAKAKGRKLRIDGGPETAALGFGPIDPIRAAVLDHAARLARGWLLAFCTLEGAAAWADIINPSAIRYKRACLWIKPDSAPQFNGQGPAQGAEAFVAAWCGGGFSRWNAGGKRGVYHHLVNPSARHGLHPTEKPLALMAELIADFTDPGDLVLDCFMGTGATGVAAIRAGRRFIGIEQNAEYFAAAVDRITAADGAPDLFGPPGARAVQTGLAL